MLGLDTYFYPVNALSKQKHTMRRGRRKPRNLKVRRYAARMSDLNEYLAMFPGATENEKNCETELNDFF